MDRFTVCPSCGQKVTAPNRKTAPVAPHFNDGDGRSGWAYEIDGNDGIEDACEGTGATAAVQTE